MVRPILKLRPVRGQKIARGKRNPWRSAEIVRLYKSGDFTLLQLATMFDVSQRRISQILGKRIAGFKRPKHARVDAIKQIYKTGKYTERELAQMFGVSRQRINQIAQSLRLGK